MKDEPFDIFRVGAELWRRRWLVLLAGLLAGVATFGLSHLGAKRYDASTDLLFQETNSFSPERTAATNLTLATQVEVVSNVKRDLRSPLSLDQLRQRVDVTPEGQADIVRITAHASTAAGAVELANTFAQEVVNVRRATAQANDQRQITSLQEQIARTPSGAFRNALQGRVQSLQVSQTAETGNVQVVAPATPPTSPAAPKPLRNGVIAAVVALLLAAVLVLTLRRFGRRLTDSELREIFDAPVMGQIPVEGRSAWRQQRHLESFHFLRSGLALIARRLRQDRRDGAAIAVTSALAGDGKTTITLRLAEAMAMSGEEVAAVDFDLRNPALVIAEEQRSLAGIGDVLTGEADIDDVLRETDTDGLKMITGGLEPERAVAGASPDRIAEVVVSLCRRAELVLFDTAPVPIAAETSDLASIVDGVLIVVDPRRDSRDDLQEVRDQLTRVGATVLGVITNRVEAAGGKRRRYGSAAHYRRYGSAIRKPSASNGEAAARDGDEGSKERAALAEDSAS